MIGRYNKRNTNCILVARNREGKTVTVRYKIKEIDPAKRRSRSEISVVNQNGDLVTSGEHILKWVPDDA